jgi:hypothetical protein
VIRSAWISETAVMASELTLLGVDERSGFEGMPLG